MNGQSKSHFITFKKPFQKSFPYDSFSCHKVRINSPYRCNPLKHKKEGVRDTLFFYPVSKISRK